MDKIIIRDLKIETIVGIYPDEKKKRRKIILNVEMRCEIRKACVSDKLADTIDYEKLKNKIVGAVSGGKFNLIEKIAEKAASICLSTHGIVSVKITADKPRAISNAKSVAIEIERP
jgi:dihydroneopterin aldolase